jgi:hypothetical protein
MANILILGDTWGITPCHEWPRNSLLVNWFEFQFLKRGHATFNRSWGGNQNHNQLNIASVFLHAVENTPFKIDLVIWFHSELLRDFAAEPPYGNINNTIEEIGFDNLINRTAERVYGTVNEMRKRFPETKWAIIGGHAPLHSPRKNLLDWAEFRIDNWRAEISGKFCPDSQCMEWLDPTKGSLYDWPAVGEEIIKREQAIREILLEATTDFDLFHNGKNPSQKVYESLAKRIIEHFNLDNEIKGRS